jgi:hypothetical protein
VKFFGATDKTTLTPAVGWVDFTQNLNGIPAILDRVDVLVLSANQPISSATKKALIDYANRGGAIVALHPGTWYAWNNFPQWNKEIVGGGTRGHDALGPFPVKITNADHAITKGVPTDFEITDELYNHVADPAATPSEVLATCDESEDWQNVSASLRRKTPEGPHRRPHTRSRQSCARSAGFPNAAREFGEVGSRRQVAARS